MISKKYISIFCALLFVLGSTTQFSSNMVLCEEDAVQGHSAIFGGGPFYSGGEPVMNILRASGFTTVLIWSIHVHADGTLYLNDELIIQDGEYRGNSSWPANLATLKQQPTSVNRIECSIGAWGTRDFENIRDLIRTNGTDPSSILYRNFEVLKDITGADAMDFDDESNYGVNSTVTFGLMLADLGLKVTLCPYTQSSFWSTVYEQINHDRPGTVDRVYLQCYAGGSGNDPSAWDSLFGNTSITPGLWCRNGPGSLCNSGDTPERIHNKMLNWNTMANVSGGFLWLFDDMLKCTEYSPIEYANAINSVFIPGVDYVPHEEDDSDDSSEEVSTIRGFSSTLGITLFVSWMGLYHILDRSKTLKKKKI